MRNHQIDFHLMQSLLIAILLNLQTPTLNVDKEIFFLEHLVYSRKLPRTRQLGWKEFTLYSNFWSLWDSLCHYIKTSFLALWKRLRNQSIVRSLVPGCHSLPASISE